MIYGDRERTAVREKGWKEMKSVESREINERSPWQEITEGNKIFEPATSRRFHTGEWRTATPEFDREKCTQCLLCAPVCPDSSIPVQNGRREDFDYDHCKGCGICAKVCPFGAITMREGK